MAKPQKAVKRLEAVAAKRDGPHPIDVHVGSRLKLRRMILGLSQESLGKALGLTFQQIQKYEKGVNRIGASRIFEMSQLLEVPVQFFYDDLAKSGMGGAYAFAEPDPHDEVMNLFNSAEGVQLCRYFAAIKDPEVKKRVLDLVKSIAENESA